MDVVNCTNKCKLLIVGGSGFIGSYVTKEALSRGFLVSVIHNTNKNLHEIFEDVEYLLVDISVHNDLSNKLKNNFFHYVINLGGYIDHSNYFDGGKKVFNAHFYGTKNLVDCIDRMFLRRFIYIGSSDEYGNNIAPQNEKQKELPMSPYSFAKTASTYFLQMLHKSEGFPAVILRLFLVYGPGQGNKRFIPQIISGCLNDYKFSASEGEQLRDFCYIDDVVDAIFCALYSDKACGEVINIASGEPLSIKNVITKITKIIGSGKPQLGEIPYRNGENMELFADITKAKKILNWKPKVEIDKGIKNTINSIVNKR
jgi:nucleoside-diphosphate-sugar epimerase